MISYHTTFEIVSPQSAEEGDFEECGLQEINLQASFRDMVELLQGTEASCSPLTPDLHGHVWFTKYGDQDWRNGCWENTGYHPATCRDERYMIKAWKLSCAAEVKAA